MTCLHLQSIHGPEAQGSRVERLWCRFHWGIAQCADECTGYEPDNPAYDREGLRALCCHLIAQCMEGAPFEIPRGNRATLYDMAFHWSVVGGLDEGAAARAIRSAMQYNREPVPRKPLITDAQRARGRIMRYSKGCTCPFCGVPITNGARTCNRHRRKAL